MKFLTDRKEIAKAINIDRIPVITMDCTQPLYGDEFYKDCYGGSKIKLDGAYKGRYGDLLTPCTVAMFGDEEGNENHFAPHTYKRICLRPKVVCLHDDFSLHDVNEMVEWSNSPTVKVGGTVLVYFRYKNRGVIRVMKVPEKVDPHGSTACELEDID